MENHNPLDVIEYSADQPAPAFVEIPSDLQSQLNAVKALAATYNLLDKGLYPASHHQVVAETIAFIRSLHEQALQVAIDHPSADLVPELKQLKESK